MASDDDNTAAEVDAVIDKIEKMSLKDTEAGVITNAVESTVAEFQAATKLLDWQTDFDGDQITEDAAVRIQANVRGYLTRKHLQEDDDQDVVSESKHSTELPTATSDTVIEAMKTPYAEEEALVPAAAAPAAESNDGVVTKDIEEKDASTTLDDPSVVDDARTTNDTLTTDQVNDAQSPGSSFGLTGFAAQLATGPTTLLSPNASVRSSVDYEYDNGAVSHGLRTALMGNISAVEVIELRSRVHQLETQLSNAVADNNALQKIHKRQDHVLHRLQAIRGTAKTAIIVDRYTEEIRILRAQLREQRAKMRDYEKQLKSRSISTQRLYVRTRKLEEVVRHSRSVSPRLSYVDMHNVDSLTDQLNKQQKRVKLLEDELAKTIAGHKRSLLDEMQRHRSTRARLRQLERQLLQCKQQTSAFTTSAHTNDSSPMSTSRLIEHADIHAAAAPGVKTKRVVARNPAGRRPMNRTRTDTSRTEMISTSVTDTIIRDSATKSHAVGSNSNVRKYKQQVESKDDEWSTNIADLSISNHRMPDNQVHPKSKTNADDLDPFSHIKPSSGGGQSNRTYDISSRGSKDKKHILALTDDELFPHTQQHPQQQPHRRPMQQGVFPWENIEQTNGGRLVH